MVRILCPGDVAIRFSNSLPAAIVRSSSGLLAAGNSATWSPKISRSCLGSSVTSFMAYVVIEYRRMVLPSTMRVACRFESRNEQFLVPVPWISKQVNLSIGTRECSKGPSRKSQFFDGRVRCTFVSTTFDFCTPGGAS